MEQKTGFHISSSYNLYTDAKKNVCTSQMPNNVYLQLLGKPFYMPWLIIVMWHFYCNYQNNKLTHC